jgi:hypothetical protein
VKSANRKLFQLIAEPTASVSLDRPFLFENTSDGVQVLHKFFFFSVKLVS